MAVDVGHDAATGRSGAAPHLTLKFLGEVAPERNGAIVALLGAAARASRPFVLRLEGVGAFPSPSRPRVVWVGVTAGRLEVVELAERVRTALEPEFGPEPEPFVPHLTLFRVRSPADRMAALALLSGARMPPPPRDVTVRELLLKESVLGPRGATHRSVASVALGAPAEAPP